MRIWTDEKIEADLRAIADGIGSFPTNSELLNLGRGDLSNAINKSGGLIAWAIRLGMQRKWSDSDFGWEGEGAVTDMFIVNGHRATRTTVKAPFDILVDDVLRVDVKTAKLATYGKSSGWYYRLGKIPQADLVLLYQADTGEFYGLPWHVCPTGNVTINNGASKYAAYKNNWPLIRSMIGIRMAERMRIVGESVEEVA